MKPLKLDSNLLAFLFGCFLCAFLWLSVEAVFWVLEKRSPDHTEAPTYPNHFFQQDAYGTFKAAPGKHHCYHKGLDGKLIYDQQYTIDQFGRRVTPVEGGARDRFAAFLGCSFTFGEGVGEKETIPYFVGENAGRYRPYNYGMMGLGPFDVLAKVESLDFKKEMGEAKGIFFYVFMADHLHRIMGSMDAMSWDFNGCYYKNENGTLVRQGDYRTGRWLETKIYTLLSKSRILRAFHVQLPMRIADNDLKLVAQAAQAMDTAIKKRYPESSFYVVLYPGLHPPQLVNYIRAAGVNVLDYTTLFSAYDPLYYISKEDQHPSVLAYQTIATHIVHDLAMERN